MFFDGATTVQLNQWHHVAMTYDGSILTLYVDGVADGSLSVNGSIITTTQPLRIGGGAPVGRAPLHFPGLIDEVELFNRALSAAEIQALFDAGSAGKCKTSITPFTDFTIEEADIRFSTDKAKDNRMNFEGTMDLGMPDDVTVSIESDSVAPVNRMDPVTILGIDFACDAVTCEAELEDPTQLFMGEPLKLEVTIPTSGVGEFEVEVKNVNTDVSTSPIEVTLTLETADKTGADTVTETEKDPRERLQFEVEDSDSDDDDEEVEEDDD